MKEFKTAAEKATDVEFDEKGIEFKIDDQVLTAYPPRDGQVALLMARMGRHASNNDKVAGLIDFFVEILDNDGHQYVVNRLMSRDDNFGVEDLSTIMSWLMEEWSDRPTRRSSASTRSRKTTGPRSVPATT